MARRKLEFTYKMTNNDRLPDGLTEGAALLIDMDTLGTVKKVGEHLRIRRQGGYCGLDVWVFLLLYFSTGAKTGLRKFWKMAWSHAEQLSTLAGRKRLATPASMSRALDAVELHLLRPVAWWLLMGLCRVEVVLRHPSVLTRDARGEGWHVFDGDPTVTTLYHRALPVDEDLPEPRRRSEDTGAAGYSGRKRGDIQFRRHTVQHAGSGVWVGAHLSPGNGLGVADFELDLDAVVQTCKSLNHPLERTVLRADGEHGSLPYFVACRQRTLPFLSRLNRPKLFEDPEVLQRLRAATWYQVPDSKAGPRRSATDIGVLTIHPGKRTRRPDGSKYEPIAMRVVAVIFPKNGQAKRGRTIDGWQVELFAVDLPVENWPAPDAIALYYGRAAEENRFAQEDRELGLDRIVSYHLPGQELATLVALSLWNMRIVHGFLLDPPPAVQPPIELRDPQVDDRVPANWPRDPMLIRALAKLDWEALLHRRPGWTWEEAAGELVCGDGRRLRLTTVRPAQHTPGRTGMIFYRSHSGCEDCAGRPDCTPRARPGAAKHVELSVPTEVAEVVRARLAQIRDARRGPPSFEPVAGQPGSRAVVDARFLPAEARAVFADVFRGGSLRVGVHLPPAKPPQPRLVAVDAAHRQRRRKTWAENVERGALPDDAHVWVQVEGTRALRTMLGEVAHRSVAAAGSRG